LKRVFLIRHGETDWNAELRWQGHIDLGLNAAGVRQAEELAENLAGERIEAFLSSDLKRASQTAEIAAAPHGAPVRTTDRIREVHVGVAEGMVRDQIIERFGEESLARWRNMDDHEFAFPGGESKRQALARGLPAIQEFLEEDGNRTVAVVFHSLLMRLVLYRIFPDLTRPLGISNCRYFELSFDPDTGKWEPEGELRAIREEIAV
jgi:2,3-bisphosphoglycerate-dependent phosphoglycerate mutase